MLSSGMSDWLPEIEDMSGRFKTAADRSNPFNEFDWRLM